MARNHSGTATVTASDLTISSPRGVVMVSVSNRDGTNALDVCVPVVHDGETDWDQLLPGETEYYRDASGRIDRVRVKAAAATAAYRVAIVEG